MVKQGKLSFKKKPKVHKDLKGFEVSIDSFGEIQSNLGIEKINSFLDKNVDDKKLKGENKKIILKKKKHSSLE